MAKSKKFTPSPANNDKALLPHEAEQLEQENNPPRPIAPPVPDTPPWPSRRVGEDLNSGGSDV